MNKEQKRKLRNISLLALVGLIGGTFAFQAFNQQAINDRLRDNEVEVGGRVHDYYNRDTENKDVFVENYGQTPIMARIRLSEFMEIQERGQESFAPLVPRTSREDVSSWTTWIPSTTELDDRQGASDAFDQYSDLTFGWARGDDFAPWYLPTFNLDENDDRTAAAGHARDWAEVGGDEDSAGATNGTTDGATHPGDGTDAYWSEGETYDNATGTWFGSQVTRETAQNLPQERPPMTMEQWELLDNSEKIGDFWVIDTRTGWAYWASELEVGETTAYLLDAAEMKPAAAAINGAYYYGINVSSDLVSPERSDEFLNDGESHDARLASLLEGIKNNAIDDSWGNPPASENAQPDELDFSIMNPGRIFTMGNQQFRYLEDMGEDNHLIIRSGVYRNVTFGEEQDERLATWYDELDPSVQAIVQPISANFVTGRVGHAEVLYEGGPRFRPINLHYFPEVAEDVTKVDEAGNPGAFALSLADIARVSGPGRGFPNHAARVGDDDFWWWLRTSGDTGAGWRVNRGADAGRLRGDTPVETSHSNGGMRPALIVNNQQN